MGKVEAAMEFAKMVQRSPTLVSAEYLIESRDRAIAGEVLDRVKAINADYPAPHLYKTRMDMLRRELTGEGRGEEVATPTVREAGDIMAAMARHRAQARDQVMGSTPLPEGAPPDDRTWFSPQGLAEHDREVAKKAIATAVSEWKSDPKVTDRERNSGAALTYWVRVCNRLGIAYADLAPVKVEYTPSDIKTRSFDFAADGVMWRIVCGEWCWFAKPGEWVKVDAGMFYHKQDAEMIVRALREAKMMPKGGG